MAVNTPMSEVATSGRNQVRRLLRGFACAPVDPEEAAAEGATVVTFIVAGEGLTPSNVTDAGETEQLGPVGATVQFRETVWLNPAMGVTVRL